jgi:GR25 family glycosyltransferase involved in LPS biosynthesis
MTIQLDSYGLDYEFVSNFGKDVLTREQISKFINLNNAEISLFLHHIECCKRIVDSNLEYGIILEDDVVFGEDFKNKLEKYINELPDNYDMLFFGEGHGAHIPSYRIVNDKNVYLKSVKLNGGASKCSDSYIISNNCCRKILNCFHKIQLIRKPYDHFLNNICLFNNFIVYWSEPTITKQGTALGLYRSSLNP